MNIVIVLTAAYMWQCVQPFQLKAFTCPKSRRPSDTGPSGHPEERLAAVRQRRNWVLPHGTIPRRVPTGAALRHGRLCGCQMGAWGSKASHRNWGHFRTGSDGAGSHHQGAAHTIARCQDRYPDYGKYLWPDSGTRNRVSNGADVRRIVANGFSAQSDYRE